MGGREVGSDDHGQNIDTYSMEFTFPNGKKAFCGFRRALQGHTEFATFVHCAKKAGQFSGNVHQATVHMFKDHRIVTWDEVVNSKFQFCDYLDTLSPDSPPPVKANAEGYFPAPFANEWKEL